MDTSRIVKATPFFYGWVILAVGTIGIISIGPSQTFTVGVFTDSFIADLNITRANIALIYGAATLSASLLLPLTGRLVDRHGPRRMVLIVVLGLGLACLVMARVQGILTLFGGLLALRFLGFGSLQLVSNNVIAQWFIRRRGMAMGVAGLSLSASLLIFPDLAQFLIDQFQWRGAWVMMGLLVWVIMLPLGWGFFRDRPELYDLEPDGGKVHLRREPVETTAEEWTLAEARRTAAFWLFALGLATLTMIMGGLVFHQISLFEVRGLSRDLAIDAFKVIALFSVVGNLGMGQLLDRFSARWLTTLTLVVLTAAMVLVQVMRDPTTGYIYAALMGLVSGAFRVIDAVIWAKYYGRRHLGAIKGATMIGVVGATALGPYPLGLSFDATGAYSAALVPLLALPVLLGLILPFVKRPEKAAGAVRLRPGGSGSYNRL